MGQTISVNQLIAHLKKYPGHLRVRMYRPPFRTAYKIKGLEIKGEVEWLYNTNSLYIPMEQMINVELPAEYKPPPRKNKNKRGDNDK